MLLDVLVADATAMITSSPFFQFTGSPPRCWPRVASTAACRRSVQGERHSRLPLNRYSKRIVLLMNEALRFLHQFERIYGSGRCGDGLRLVGVGSGPSHPASVS